MTQEDSVCYVIQYDGLTRGEHEIDLAELGESLQGFSKVLACAGHFITTGQVNRQYGKLTVKVSTNANLEAGCIEIPVWITNCASEIFSGFAGAVLSAVVAYILSRRGKEEMEHLSKALEQSLNQNKDLQDKLLSTIDKLADSLSAANRQALAPIGKSCRTIALMDEKKSADVLKVDETLKRVIDKQPDAQISPEEEFTGTISELDLVNGSCKVSLTDGDGERINGVITDPVLMMPKNVYLTAFSNRSELTFRAKVQLSREGDIVKFFISDSVRMPSK